MYYRDNGNVLTADDKNSRRWACTSGAVLHSRMSSHADEENGVAMKRSVNVALCLGLLSVMGCAAPGPASSDRASGGPSISSRVGVEPASDSIVREPDRTTGLSRSVDRPVTHLDGSCPSGEPLATSLTSIAATASTVTGVAALTGKTMTATAGNHSSAGNPVVYTEVAITVSRPLIGPRLPEKLVVYLPGGTLDAMETTVAPLLQSGWAPDGTFFGTIAPSDVFPGAYTMEVLPLVNDAIIFPNIGCRFPGDLASTPQGDTTVRILSDGKLTDRTGSFPSVPLETVAELLRK